MAEAWLRPRGHTSASQAVERWVDSDTRLMTLQDSDKVNAAIDVWAARASIHPV